MSGLKPGPISEAKATAMGNGNSDGNDNSDDNGNGKDR